jgi:hypothetical protein
MHCFDNKFLNIQPMIFALIIATHSYEDFMQFCFINVVLTKREVRDPSFFVTLSLVKFNSFNFIFILRVEKSI